SSANGAPVRGSGEGGAFNFWTFLARFPNTWHSLAASLSRPLERMALPFDSPRRSTYTARPATARFKSRSNTVDLFPTMTEKAYESVHFFHDEKTGLRAIVSLHDTTFGPGLGGTRAISTYETEADAERGIVQGNDRPEPPSEEHTSELQSRENLVCRLL